MTDKGSWAPLLTGDEAEAVRAVVREIAATVRERPGANTSDELPEGSPFAMARDASLAAGMAGQGILFAYLARAEGREDDLDTMTELIDRAIDAVAEVQMPDGLYSGFTGIAWSVEHLRHMLFDEEDEDPNQAIDEAVLMRAGTTPWREDYDLISGLAGLGVYALERLPTPAAEACLAQILARLEETSEPRDGGRTWHTAPALLPAWQREIAPEGYYNLGLAHGVPGVIGLLARMVSAGVALDRSRPLLEGAVTWMLAQRLDPEMPGWFDSWQTDAEPHTSRLAWCYGDPGAACAIYLAGAGARVAQWREAALAIMRKSLERPVEEAGVKDVGLCHGAFGLAHIYNRFFQASREEPFAERARFWYRRGLEMRSPGEGTAGFLVYHPEPDGTPKWVPDAGFLTGAAGDALALLAAITTVEPSWDRIMLTSLPVA